ncbi:MAG: hypothetical protein HZB37_06380 [Planctomycetes bacterium]|nr:hypothetical protein [Planctomycetota bacterium]
MSVTKFIKLYIPILLYRDFFAEVTSSSVISTPHENADTVRSAFVADAPGNYVIQLTVTDSQTQSVSDTVAVSFGNVRPVANAGKSLAIKDISLLDGLNKLAYRGATLSVADSPCLSM